MNLQEIKAAVEAGQLVCWGNSLYRVVKETANNYLILCGSNKHAIGLTWADGVTLNGKPEDFFILY